MLQKLTLGFLILTVLGAVGLGIYENTQNDDEPQNEVLRGTNTPTNVPTTPPTQGLSPTPTAMPTEVAQVEFVEMTPEAIQPEPQQDMLTMLGDPWQGAGTILELADAGITLDDGTFVELAPPFFWTDISLAIGDRVVVNGFNNGEQIHAQTMTHNGDIYTFRTTEGQPLWSGGAGTEDNRQGAGQAQVPMSEWETYTGSLTMVTNNSLTMQTTDGQDISLQLGQPRFRDEQNITFNVGDLVEVSGYWQSDRFRVGTLTKTQTNETLLLLDPNGRPLWGGPGRAGNESGGNQSAGNDTQGQGGNRQGNSGGGNGYQGGRNQATEEANQ